MESAMIADSYNSSPAYTDDLTQAAGTGTYEYAKNILQTYIVPLIIITGFFGNTICFIVFVASPLKRISTSVYLAALAFSDTGFLVCLGIGWLESLGVRFFHKEGICQLTVYSSYVFSFTSIWFVNAFTLEMYIAVFYSRKSMRLCTPSTARIVVCLLSLVAGLIYIYAFFIAKIVKMQAPEMEVCLIVPEDKHTAMIFSIFDTFLTLVVPFTMIIFMIVRLLITTSRFYKTEPGSTANSTLSGTNVDDTETVLAENVATQTARQANEAHTKFTCMLVVTVVVFLVLNLPSHAIKVQFLFRSLASNNIEFTETEGFMQVIFQILYYANFSVNFLLYSACGRGFRLAMMRLSLNVRYGVCRKVFECRGRIQQRLLGNGKVHGGSNEPTPMEVGHQQQHSRLVDIHLNEIRFSELPSMESQFICKSPPCLLAVESEQLLEE